MSLRDVDLVTESLLGMQLLVDKCNFYASQVQDPALRNLLQDAARLHQQHVATLSMVRGQIQQQPGTPPVAPAQMGQPAGVGQGAGAGSR